VRVRFFLYEDGGSQERFLAKRAGRVTKIAGRFVGKKNEKKEKAEEMKQNKNKKRI